MPKCLFFSRGNHDEPASTRHPQPPQTLDMRPLLTRNPHAQAMAGQNSTPRSAAAPTKANGSSTTAPYANGEHPHGPPHQQSPQGHRRSNSAPCRATIPLRPGWDCHGPHRIRHPERLGPKFRELSKEELRTNATTTHEVRKTPGRRLQTWGCSPITSVHTSP